MPAQADRQRFRNEDLTLAVSRAVDRARWDESRYEAFLDTLCGVREYQKDALRVALRFLLGGKYTNLRGLARENFDGSAILPERYGSWEGMQRNLQLPDLLSASLDLATGTGKSYVLYGLAAILLAEGVVDNVLVLCPSTTIENGLLTKFKELATRADLRDLLPPNAKVAAPRVINASESIVDGSLCVENYHAILEHVGSSIRDSLMGKGERTLVLNDEAHHVANESGTAPRKWKEFLTDPAYGFRRVIGVSGTCYAGDDYFADVIYRYSLRQAMEDRVVKRVDYVAEMPHTGVADEKWQLVRNRHDGFKRSLAVRDLLPLTIVVTQTVAKCKDVAEELKAFLVDTEGVTPEVADERVLCVYNNAPDVLRLPYVDLPGSKVEWIVSVSMLNEGWDVKRVFQIVPHEERAFNSKLLIAQVLGRGLRVPDRWGMGAQPEVVVFNHDSWASRIRQLVNEVLEIEKRLSTHIVSASPFHFDLHNIDYTLQTKTVTTPMDRPYNLLEKGYVDLAADVASEQVSGVFERAATGDQYRWQTEVRQKTYTSQEIAAAMYERLEWVYDPDDPDPNLQHRYTDDFPLERLERIVITSLERRNMTLATETVRQTFLKSLGTLRRTESQSVRYTQDADALKTISTQSRQSDTVSASELRRDKTYYFTEDTLATLKEEQAEFFKEATEPGSGFKYVQVANPLDLKTPLNAVIADSEPERKFINALLDRNNLTHYDGWIKSTAMRFYELDYSVKVGAHTKQNKFSPDFFIKSGDTILVVEIKDDDQIREPSDENRRKNLFAVQHFARLNHWLEEKGYATRYQFNFVTPTSFGAYFSYLRDGKITAYKSPLDLKLAEES